MTKDNASADSRPQMLTFREVAPMLRVSRSALYRNPAWRTRLQAVRVGRQWLVRADVVDQLLRGQGAS